MATTTASSSDKEVYHNVQEKDVQIVNRSGSEGDASVEAGEVNNPLHRKLESRHMQMIAIGMFVLSCLSCLLFFRPSVLLRDVGGLVRGCVMREGGREGERYLAAGSIYLHLLFFSFQVVPLELVSSSDQVLLCKRVGLRRW